MRCSACTVLCVCLILDACVHCLAVAWTGGRQSWISYTVMAAGVGGRSTKTKLGHSGWKRLQRAQQCPRQQCIGVNRPAIVREIPHFGLIPAFPHFCENVPHFWLYFEITKIAENRNNFSCTETFCSKKLCENVNNSIT